MRAGGVNNMKNYKIAVAGTGARDIIGSTKKTGAVKIYAQNCLQAPAE